MLLRSRPSIEGAVMDTPGDAAIRLRAWPPLPAIEGRNQRAYARAAAILLDQRCSGWASQINIEILDMGNYRNCILGQLYGNFSRGLAELGLNGREDIVWGFRNWPGLKEAWKDEAKQRL
jgi:hypothetical protein